MVVEDGVVRGLWVDADGRVRASGADAVLAKL
jgi:peroxiredoxin